jgi:hypothetical protein
MDTTQIGIATFGPLAIILLSCRGPHIRRWGYIAGILSQPFWFWTAWVNGQWGIFILSIFYAAAWINGINNFWLRPWMKGASHHDD